MGNNQSSGSKSAAPPSSQQQQHPASGSTTSPASSHDAAAARHHHAAGAASSASSSRNMIPAHAPHRSAAAPPEPSLAQAQGSTSIASRPRSISAASPTLPPTAVSSSPRSTSSALPVPAPPPSSKPAEPAAPIPIAEPSKPVDVPGGGTPGASRTPGINRTDSEMADSHLIASGSITDMYNARPPRLPLPIEEEVHTPGSPILGADEASPLGEVPEVEHESSGALTRKSSAVSQATLDDEDSHELRVDRSRPVVPTRIEWNGGGEKVYVTGTIFQWSRKQRLHPV